MYFPSVLHKEEGGKKEEISRLPVLPSFWPPAGQETTIFFQGGPRYVAYRDIFTNILWPSRRHYYYIYIQKVHKCGTRDAEDF